MEWKKKHDCCGRGSHGKFLERGSRIKGFKFAGGLCIWISKSSVEKVLFLIVMQERTDYHKLKTFNLGCSYGY